MNISVIGLGKLGTPLAVTLARAGHRVWGVDANPATVSALAAGQAPVCETQLQAELSACEDHLIVGLDPQAAVLATDLTFVIVPTPSLSKGGFDLTFVKSAMQAVGQGISQKSQYHTVVLVSTVLPGDSQREILPLLESATGRQCGDRWSYCYSPEFIALGSIIANLRNPDLILIGHTDASAGDLVESVLTSLARNQPRVVKTNLVNAELIKLSINTFVTTKISYANMISELCDQLPGAQAGVVCDALGADSRIGQRYIQPGLGFGGPCFPRDNRALSYLAHTLGVNSDLAKATQVINQRQPARLLSWVQRFRAQADCSVGILGQSYKPHTGVCEESQAVILAQRLCELAVPLQIWDPQATPQAQLAAHWSQPEQLVLTSDIVVLATAWPEFHWLPWQQRQRPGVLLDPWHMMNQAPGEHWSLYHLGEGVKN